MNLDDLTLGQLKEIAKLTGGLSAPMSQDPDIGKYVVVRTIGAGVHCGVLVSRNGQDVRLSDTRRIWRWFGAKTLSEISQQGIDTSHVETNVSQSVPSNTLPTAIEVIACSADAEKCLRGAKWNRK